MLLGGDHREAALVKIQDFLLISGHMPRKKRSGVSTSPTQRQLRVGELVRHALAELFVDNPVRDSALEGVAITVLEVSVNRDLSVAKVFVLPLAGEREETVVAALERHRKFIRGRLARLVRASPADSPGSCHRACCSD